jgi:23S rRNA pseudouridine1911/1915/1917 synthase
VTGDPRFDGGLDAEVPALLDGVRLDRAVSLLSGLSRAVVAELIAQGKVRVDGVAETRRSTLVREGSRIAAPDPGPAHLPLVAEPEVEFAVVHEDDHIIVVNKPWELVVHPGAGRRRGTLVGGILARYPDVGDLAIAGVGDPDRPGIVHRLDRGTSGLLVVARTPGAVESLSEQMARHTAERRYAALLHGRVSEDAGVVDAPVGRSSRRPTLMTVSATGRQARTAYEVTARYDAPFPSTLVVAALETGRTHQVRVHMAAIGHPVVGDPRYGTDAGRARAPGLRSGRFFLHAFELAFDHPADGHRVRFTAPLADDLVAVLGEAPELR